MGMKVKNDMKEMNEKPRKKSHKGRNIVLGIICALLVLFIVVCVYAYSIVSKINKADTNSPTEEASSDSVPDEDLISDPAINDSLRNADVSVMSDSDIKNILLIGQDRREGQGRQRSDSMILCTINTKTKSITLTSIMRDLYVAIPGHKNNRINAAYQFGGMLLLDQTIEQNLGVHVDGNVEVDFDGFIKSLSRVGNIDIELKQEEADFLNKSGWASSAAKESGTTNEGWNLKAGINSLTPEQALAYSRTRYVGHSDWERTDRQRRVISAAFDKLKDKNVSEILSIVSDICPNLTTDLSDTQILGYAYTVAVDKMSIGASYRLPYEGMYTNQTLGKGMEVLVPDLEKNAAELHKDLYG